MAVKPNNTPRFVVRLLGATAAVVAVIGAVLWWQFTGVDEVIARMGRLMFFVGLVFPVLWAAVEIGPLTKALATSRGAVGGNALVQIAVAAAILVAVNWFAADHYVRFDWTRDHAFTLPPAIAEQMAQLHDDTDIVVVVTHVSFAQRGGGQPDRYDLAAEKKIVEKVKDLASLFQDAGPRFHVRTLDVQDEHFGDKVDAIRNQERKEAADRGTPKTSPLADAIAAAPENSIFFRSRGKVQQLAFHDVYQVDKEKSIDNLVLNFQGVEPFARKIFNIEEKKPRVTVAVVHPALSFASDHPLLTMNGAKKALESQGFLCSDVLLRKLDPEGSLSPEAAALSFDESRFEQIEDELADIDDVLRPTERELPKARKLLEVWKSPLEEIQKKYIYVRLPNGQEGVVPRETLKQLEDRKIPVKTVPVDEGDRVGKLRILNQEVALFEQQIEEARKGRALLVKEQRTLNVDELAERKRIADVETKMKQLLADTDLLILPRFTFLNLAKSPEEVISNKAHKLDDAQLRAIKSFMKAGKPVLFLLGPVNEKRDIPEPPGGGGDDRLEPALVELGIVMPKQTILYAKEMSEFNERKAGILSGRELKLPPPLVDWLPGTGEVAKYAGPNGINPIRESLRMTALSLLDRKDTPAARVARKNLQTVLTVDFKDVRLADLLASLKKSVDEKIAREKDEKEIAVKEKAEEDKTDEEKADKPLRFRVLADPPLSDDMKVSLKASDATVRSILDQLSAATGFGWYVDSNPESGDRDGEIVIRKYADGIERGYKFGIGKTLADLQIRHPRPVYPLLSADIGKTNAALFDESAVFLMTDDETWNENQPFVSEKREVPRYQQSGDSDPRKGTIEEERRGPFPIGVAVERKIPADWYEDKSATPAKTRLSVLGSGGIFVGAKISPIREKLLLDVSNWLLGRDDLLARSAGVWSYPRVELTPKEDKLWFLGVQFGLPLLFMYLGVLVWFVRRMR